MNESNFTKLAADGAELAPDATNHVAVRDNRSGLIITTATLSDECVTHEQAEKIVAECDVMGANDWRLPTVEELFVIADRTKVNPAIDTDLFPGTESDWYWSSSLYAGDPDYAWVVYFGGGYSTCDHRDGDGAFVRAVRGPVASAASQ